MADARPERGLLDTSVVIGLEGINPAVLPREVAMCSITLAELTAGPHAATNAGESARRQDRLQRAEAAFDPIPFDIVAARAYGLVYTSALAQGLPLYTRHLDGFRGLDDLIDLRVV